VQPNRYHQVIVVQNGESEKSGSFIGWIVNFIIGGVKVVVSVSVITGVTYWYIKKVHIPNKYYGSEEIKPIIAHIEKYGEDIYKKLKNSQLYNTLRGKKQNPQIDIDLPVLDNNGNLSQLPSQSPRIVSSTSPKVGSDIENNQNSDTSNIYHQTSIILSKLDPSKSEQFNGLGELTKNNNNTELHLDESNQNAINQITNQIPDDISSISDEDSSKMITELKSEIVAITKIDTNVNTRKEYYIKIIKERYELLSKLLSLEIKKLTKEKKLYSQFFFDNIATFLIIFKYLENECKEENEYIEKIKNQMLWFKASFQLIQEQDRVDLNNLVNEIEKIKFGSDTSNLLEPAKINNQSQNNDSQISFETPDL